MATGSINLLGSVSGGPDGARTFGPLAITTNAAVIAETSVALIAGTVTVTVPAGATAVVFFPPNAATPIPNPAFGGTVQFKTVAGDAGTFISPKNAMELPFDPVNMPANLYFTSTAAGTLTAWFM